MEWNTERLHQQEYHWQKSNDLGQHMGWNNERLQQQEHHCHKGRVHGGHF